LFLTEIATVPKAAQFLIKSDNSKLQRRLIVNTFSSSVITTAQIFVLCSQKTCCCGQQNLVYFT